MTYLFLYRLSAISFSLSLCADRSFYIRKILGREIRFCNASFLSFRKHIRMKLRAERSTHGEAGSQAGCFNIETHFSFFHFPRFRNFRSPVARGRHKKNFNIFHDFPVSRHRPRSALFSHPLILCQFDSVPGLLLLRSFREFSLIFRNVSLSALLQRSADLISISRSIRLPFRKYTTQASSRNCNVIRFQTRYTAKLPQFSLNYSLFYYLKSVFPLKKNLTVTVAIF